MRHKTKSLLEKLSRQANGVFTVRDAENVGISARTLYRLSDSGEIVRISRGVYQLAGIAEAPQASPDYAAIKARIPGAVICTVSALYHYELTVEIPRYIHLAIARNAPVPTIDYPSVRIYRMSPAPFTTGVEQTEITGIKMNIFSPEKTIADCFKYRNRLGTDLAIEGLKKYLLLPQAKPARVFEMAKVCRVEKVIRPYMEAMI